MTRQSTSVGGEKAILQYIDRAKTNKTSEKQLIFSSRQMVKNITILGYKNGIVNNMTRQNTIIVSTVVNAVFMDSQEKRCYNR